MEQHMVDHVVVLVAPEELDTLSERLQAAGLRLGDTVTLDSLGGIPAQMLPLRGGGYLALTRAPGPEMPTPLIVTVGYATGDAMADWERWKALPGFERAEAGAHTYTRGDQTPAYEVVINPPPAGPGPTFFLQERRLFPVPFPGDAANAPAVTAITVSGPGARYWRDVHEEWFGMPAADNTVRAAATTVFFEEEASHPLSISVTLDSGTSSEEIVLFAGAIRFGCDERAPGEE